MPNRARLRATLITSVALVAVSGSGQGFGIDLQPDFTVQPEIDNPTIANGTIQNFASAVAFSVANNPTLNKLTLINDAAAGTPVLYTEPNDGTRNLRLTHSSILDTNGRITTSSLETSQFTVSDTVINTGEFYFSQTVGGPTFTDDRFTDAKLTLDIEGGTTVTGNKFTDSTILNDDFGYGYDTFENNTFTGAGTALTLADVPNQQVIGNTFTGNDIGANVSDSVGDTISGNTFTRNATAGLYFNTAGAPAGVGDPGSPLPGAQLTLSGNTANRNGTNPDGTLDPDDNAVNAGLYLYTPNGGATITNNSTTHNAGYGIYAWLSSGASNTSSGNVSTNDLARCFPLGTCTYQ